MTRRDEHDIDPAILALYRAAAVERPAAQVDEAVLSRAAFELRRMRYMPWAALAATLLVVILLAPVARGQLSTSYDHEAAEAYLMQVQAPVAPSDAGSAADAYLLQMPPAAAGF